MKREGQECPSSLFFRPQGGATLLSPSSNGTNGNSPVQPSPNRHSGMRSRFLCRRGGGAVPRLLRKRSHQRAVSQTSLLAPRSARISVKPHLFGGVFLNFRDPEASFTPVSRPSPALAESRNRGIAESRWLLRKQGTIERSTLSCRVHSEAAARAAASFSGLPLPRRRGDPGSPATPPRLRRCAREGDKAPHRAKAPGRAR
jgi:hypothetical protein